VERLFCVEGRIDLHLSSALLKGVLLAVSMDKNLQVQHPRHIIIINTVTTTYSSSFVIALITILTITHMRETEINK
jgi:hypothetical protein